MFLIDDIYVEEATHPAHDQPGLLVSITFRDNPGHDDLSFNEIGAFYHVHGVRDLQKYNDYVDANPESLNDHNINAIFVDGPRQPLWGPTHPKRIGLEGNFYARGLDLVVETVSPSDYRTFCFTNQVYDCDIVRSTLVALDNLKNTLLFDEDYFYTYNLREDFLTLLSVLSKFPH